MTEVDLGPSHIQVYVCIHTKKKEEEMNERGRKGRGREVKEEENREEEEEEEGRLGQSPSSIKLHALDTNMFSDQEHFQENLSLAGMSTPYIFADSSNNISSHSFTGNEVQSQHRQTWRQLSSGGPRFFFVGLTLLSLRHLFSLSQKYKYVPGGVRGIGCSTAIFYSHPSASAAACRESVMN